MLLAKALSKTVTTVRAMPQSLRRVKMAQPPSSSTQSILRPARLMKVSPLLQKEPSKMVSTVSPLTPRLLKDQTQPVNQVNGLSTTSIRTATVSSPTTKLFQPNLSATVKMGKTVRTVRPMHQLLRRAQTVQPLLSSTQSTLKQVRLILRNQP